MVLDDRSARLLREMPTPFFSITFAWILDFLNPAAERALGIRAADVEGKIFWDAFPGVRESPLGEAYRSVMAEGQHTSTEAYYPPFNRWYEAWTYPFESGIGVYFLDITDRKLNEFALNAEKQKWEALFFGTASPLVFFRGPEMIYEMYNAQYADLVPNRNLLGRPLLEARPELAGSEFPNLIREVFDTGTPYLASEVLSPLTDAHSGEVVNRYFDSAISRIDDGEGKPYGVLVQANEVTDRVHARRRIEQALAARDAFLSIASHELRTPITGMKLQAQIMKRAIARNDGSAFSPERVTKLVNLTDSALSRMDRLVEDMLDVTRIDRGKLELVREPTEFSTFVVGVIDRFSEELSRADVQTKIDSLTPDVCISIDRFRMEQVVTNLITNVIRYAPGAPLTVSFHASEERVRVVFQDAGPGISEENRERVFERFERIVSANEVSGLGLGLHIARFIVLAHGGRLSVESCDGAPGACFIVELPVASFPA
jgi:signal transduction histidine kinase